MTSFIWPCDQFLVTSDQFLVTSDQFEMRDDQNWSPNQLVTAGHDWSWPAVAMTGHQSHKTPKFPYLNSLDIPEDPEFGTPDKS